MKNIGTKFQPYVVVHPGFLLGLEVVPAARCAALVPALGAPGRDDVWGGVPAKQRAQVELKRVSTKHECMNK